MAKQGLLNNIKHTGKWYRPTEEPRGGNNYTSEAGYVNEQAVTDGVCLKFPYAKETEFEEMGLIVDDGSVKGHQTQWRWSDELPPTSTTTSSSSPRRGPHPVGKAMETVIIHKDEALLVEGRIPHSCWNNTDGMTKMIGITVQ